MLDIHTAQPSIGFVLLAALAACSGASDPLVSSPGSDAGEADARVTSDGGTETDASSDAPTTTDARAASDATARDATPDTSPDAATDAAQEAADAAVDAPIVDASPILSDASDAASLDAAPLGLVVTSATTMVHTPSDPAKGTCTLATLGTVGIFDRTSVVSSQVVTLPDATFCDRSDSFGKTQYEWNAVDDVRMSSSFVGTPVNATWAGFLRFDKDGAFVGVMSIALLDTGAAFVPTCRYQGYMAQALRTRGTPPPPSRRRSADRVRRHSRPSAHPRYA